ncbi:unnamed protein product, partial [Laminaria digitata]
MGFEQFEQAWLGMAKGLGVTADVGQYGMFCSAAHEACCKVGAEQQLLDVPTASPGCTRQGSRANRTAKWPPTTASGGAMGLGDLPPGSPLR